MCICEGIDGSGVDVRMCVLIETMDGNYVAAHYVVVCKGSINERVNLGNYQVCGSMKITEPFVYPSVAFV